jgi:hypothetical protein
MLHSTRSMPRLAAIGLALAVSVAGRAGAQAPAAPAAPEQRADAVKAEARVHFDRGVALVEQGAWSAALAEFRASRRLFPTRNATSNAALCLRKLERFDEALELYEVLLREFAEMPADLRAEAQRAVAELRQLSGTLDVQGAEPDAAVTLDGRARGDFPLLEPLRTTTGSHVLRVYKEGFEPFEARVEVAAGQTVRTVARLRPLAESGRLRVTEARGRMLAVVVDGNVVGKTPWEGSVPPGEHTVVLRGEGDLGTQPASVPVRLRERAQLSLSAEDLGASVRIVPTPAGATVAIDSVTVGHGIWEGRLRAGAHRIELAAEGFVPETRRVELGRGRHEVIAAALRRDPESPVWRRPPHFLVELDGAFQLLAPTFGGDVARGCGGAACDKTPGLGGYALLRGGYEFRSGVGFGATVGYLLAQQTTTGRTLALTPTGEPPDSGTASDRLVLRGLVAGAWAGLSLGERFPVHLRLGGGALIGSMGDLRTGTFVASNGARYGVGPLGVAPGASFVYLAPEVRAGVRLGQGFELSAGIELWALFAVSRPAWPAGQSINAGPDGAGAFPADALVSPVSVAIAPGLGARYDF